MRTLIVSADAAHSLGDVLGERLGPEPKSIAPNLSALEVDARAELQRHWGRIRDYLVALFRYQGIEEVLAEELALLPGAEELTTLMVVDEHARSGAYDFIVVDCAPTDSTLRLVTLPDVSHSAIRILLKIQRAVAAIVTPLAAGLVPAPLPDSGVFKDAERLLYQTLGRLRERLDDCDTSVRLVVTPERMVIEEARRAYTELSLFGLRTDAVVMNRMLPDAAADEEFFQDWGRVQAERFAEVRAAFAPLPVLAAPLQADEVIGVDRLALHAAELFAELDPAAMMSSTAGVRFLRRKPGYQVRIPLPGARAADLDVTMVEDELLVRAGQHRRALKLPRRIASCVLDAARMDDGDLVVSFAPQAEHAAPHEGTP